MSAASRQMMQSVLRSAKTSHVARSHLFLASRAGLKRGQFWPQTMASDVLVYDFQDGCHPGEETNVFESIARSDQVFPGSVCSVRLIELECENTGRSQETAALDQIRSSLSQPQVRWLQLPMCNNSEDVQRYVDIVNDVNNNWLSEHGQLQIICETPWLQKNLDDVLTDHQEIAAVVVGGGDYSRYAQMSVEKVTELLRWDVLNACMRHGRFPIDSPPLGITSDKASHFDGGHAAGMRASVVLHPSLVQSCNETFSPSVEHVEEQKSDVERWISFGATGYHRGSGNDFIGPPHMKNMVWEANYAAKVNGKPTFFIKVDHLLPPLMEFLSRSPSAGSLLDPVLPLLALGAAAHPDHRRLLANLSSSECNWKSASMDRNGKQISQSINDARSVGTHVLHRQMTSSGKVIVTALVNIFNDQHVSKLSYIRKFLEEPNSHDDMGDDSWSVPKINLPDRITVPIAMAQAGKVMSENIVIAPNLEMHEDFCALLNYDAPLHHTETPTIPSTLHLACHQIYSADNAFTDLSLNISDVTYHSQMKPEQRCKCTVHVDEVGGEGAYISILCSIDGDGRMLQVLSTVLFRTDVILAESTTTDTGTIEI